MRDQSSAYWFQAGDRVQVIENVERGANNSVKQNLKGWQGVVVQAFEKCEVDPTCCCAEFVDRNMAVTVEFIPSEQQKQQGEILTSAGEILTSAGESNTESSAFTYFFAEEELEKVAVPSNVE